MCRIRFPELGEGFEQARQSRLRAGQGLGPDLLESREPKIYPAFRGIAAAFFEPNSSTLPGVTRHNWVATPLAERKRSDAAGTARFGLSVEALQAGGQTNAGWDRS